MSPISEDDDDDIFVDNSELKAVVKVYYERTREAVIPQAVDMDILPPNKFKYFKEYILVSYDVDDFVTHIRKYSQYD